MVPFVSNTAFSKQDSLPVVRQFRGSWKNPLDVNEMMKEKRKAVDRHVDLGGKKPDFFVDAVPNFSEYAKLVDYIVGVRPNGMPTQHVGIAGNFKSVQHVHSEADEMLSEVRKKARGDQ